MPVRLNMYNSQNYCVLRWKRNGRFQILRMALFCNNSLRVKTLLVLCSQEFAAASDPSAPVINLTISSTNVHDVYKSGYLRNLQRYRFAKQQTDRCHYRNACNLVSDPELRDKTQLLSGCVLPAITILLTLQDRYIPGFHPTNTRLLLPETPFYNFLSNKPNSITKGAKLKF